MQNFTQGDARVMQTAGYLGAYIPLAIVDLTTNEDNDKTYTAASMAGSILGLGLGYKLIQNKEISSPQGTLVSLGELAGGLIGLGVGYLVTSEESDAKSEIYLTSSSLGAILGFWGTYNAFAKNNFDISKNLPLKFNFSPVGLALLADKNRLIPKNKPFQLIKLEYVFYLERL